MSRNFKTIFLSIVFLLLSFFGMAQEAGAEAGVTSKDVMLLMITVMIVIAVVTLILAITILYLLRSQLPQSDKVKKPWWSRVNRTLTDAVPIEEEASIQMDHEYDGIRELDNNLPPWWIYGFYLTIIWAIGYFGWFHYYPANWTSTKQYEKEMAVAEVEKSAYLAQASNLVDESSVETLTDGVSLASGKELYSTLCVACHGDLGQGGIGPNLTDDYWLHGGSISDVFSTVKYGVAEKGMIAWQDQLSPKEMHQVASYIMTMKGTNVPGGKTPEGEKEVPDSENAATDTTDIALIH